jgi:hypothetical protein
MHALLSFVATHENYRLTVVERTAVTLEKPVSEFSIGVRSPANERRMAAQ